MSVLQNLVNPSINIMSPVVPDFTFSKKKTKDGEVPQWVESDGSELIRSNGYASDWSLNSLLSAGINPSFPIHTSPYATRLDGLNDLESASQNAIELLGENGEGAPASSGE